MYHPGELEAQERAGVRDLAKRVGRIISPTIPAAASGFLAARSFVIAATRSPDGAVHASLLAGAPGFAHVTGERSLTLHPASGHVAAALGDLDATGVLGLLAIDFPTRRRMRANGRATVRDGVIVMETRQVYSNCPQYIRQRPDATPPIVSSPPVTEELSPDQRAFIARADTFFIASAHPQAGADASHRGGEPGFVHAEPTRISWPDYSGNNMFNTLGNLLVEPRCALLFADFPTGEALRVEGRAAVTWREERRIAVHLGSR